MKWSLSEMYDGFNSKKFQNDLKNLENDLEKFNKWSDENFNNANNANKIIEEYINKYNKLSKYYTLLHYSQLINSTNTQDNDAIKNINKIENLFTNLAKPVVMFQKYLLKIDNIKDLVNKSEFLKNHEFFIIENKEYAKYSLSENEETLYNKLQITGSNAWENLRNQLTSTIMIDIEINNKKEKLPLSSIRNLAYHSSSEIRKKAYDKELESYKNIDKSCAFALNSIKGEVLTIAEKRGFESILDMTLKNSRMDKETLNAMLESLKDNIKIFKKYFLYKSELLGHKSGLPFYDIFAQIGSSNMTFSYEEASEYIINNFYKFSNNLGNYAKKAFNKKWIDPFPKEGKVGGAFCCNIHDIKESRILSNFEGSFNDMLTLAHELGHGYHGECLKNEYFANSSYSMPIAETASIFCETLICDSSLNEANEKEKFIILENDISGMSQTIVDIYSRFLFEDEIINKRKNGPLSVDEINNIMIESQIEAYGEGLDKNYLHKYMWICKPHYYSANQNYYNFPYAYGLLFAKGLYSKYLNERQKFVNKYDELLSSTGKNNLKNIALIVDIDVTKKSFWDESFRIISKQIDEFINLKP